MNKRIITIEIEIPEVPTQITQRKILKKASPKKNVKKASKKAVPSKRVATKRKVAKKTSKRK